MKDYAAVKVKVCVVCEGFSARTQHAWYDQYVEILQTSVEAFFFFFFISS